MAGNSVTSLDLFRAIHRGKIPGDIKLILWGLLGFWNHETQEAFPSLAGLTEAIGIAMSTTRIYLAKAIDEKWIIRKKAKKVIVLPGASAWTYKFNVSKIYASVPHFNGDGRQVIGSSRVRRIEPWEPQQNKLLLAAPPVEIVGEEHHERKQLESGEDQYGEPI